MKKFLMIILLVISMTLSACSSKDNQELVGEVEENQSTSIENEEVDKNLEDEHIESLEDEEKILDENSEESEEKEKEEESKDSKEKDQLDESTKKIEEKTEELKEKAPENPGDKVLVKTETKKVEPEKKAEAPKVEKANALHIEGKVGKAISLNLDDLKAMNDIIFKGNFYSLNNFGTTAHTEFKGVNLWSLLKSKAEILDSGSKVKIIASDGYEMEFTVEEVKKQDYIDETDSGAKFPIIIAWEENGEEYDLSDGLPFKLVIGQKQAGDINKPQWVSNIEKIVVE